MNVDRSCGRRLFALRAYDERDRRCEREDRAHIGGAPAERLLRGADRHDLGRFGRLRSEPLSQELGESERIDREL